VAVGLDRVAGTLTVMREWRGGMRMPLRPAEEVAHARDARVRALVEEAATTVPHYRDRFRELGIDAREIATAEDLVRLPLLDRATVAADPRRLRPAGVADEDVTVVHTSGVTGEPLPIAHDRASLLRNIVWSRRESKPVSTFGVPAFGGSVVAVLEPEATARQVDRANRGLAWRPGRPKKTVVSTDDPLDVAVAAIEEAKPDLVVGFGSYLELLFRTVAARGGLAHLPKVIRYGADAMTDYGRREIERALSVPVLSGYGAAESLRLGYVCEQRNGFHLHDDLVHVVAVDEAGAAVPDGTTGELVVTNLVNRGTVLLNYRLGDLGRIEREACPCGRASARIVEVVGRTADVVRLPSGRRVTPDEVARSVEAPEVVRFQLAERAPGRFELRVRTVDDDPAAAALEVVAAGARALLEGAAVDVVHDQALAAGTGGKFRPVVPTT
jgi:phenylacetate-CoA ligase